MIVTHNDIDHSGGAASVLENFEVASMYSSLAAGHPLLSLAPDAQRCEAGQAWTWDGVRFELLHPENAEAKAKKVNDLSCVLKVSAGAHSMLLTGDIEKPSEAQLLARAPGTFPVDVLLVPHHGSRTSSSAEFLAAVRPAVAVVPVGYRNRFGHPSAEVVARYGSAGIPLRRTDLEGAVTVHLLREKIEIKSQRRQNMHYWHDAPP
jgi:competence protein ComEC